MASVALSLAFGKNGGLSQLNSQCAASDYLTAPQKNSH
jgi:hypothetical protein